MSSLEFLQTPEAEAITFENLEANNIWIRTALGLIAAKRWPKRLINLPLSHNEERVKLLAALAMIHPELEPAVRAQIPVDEFEKLRAKILTLGPAGLFGLPGDAGLVF